MGIHGMITPNHNNPPNPNFSTRAQKIRDSTKEDAMFYYGRSSSVIKEGRKREKIKRDRIGEDA